MLHNVYFYYSLVLTLVSGFLICIVLPQLTSLMSDRKLRTIVLRKSVHMYMLLLLQPPVESTVGSISMSSLGLLLGILVLHFGVEHVLPSVFTRLKPFMIRDETPKRFLWTPVMLIVSTSAPFWLSSIGMLPSRCTNAAICAIGGGDAAAALVGRWSNRFVIYRSKTLEGLLGFIFVTRFLLSISWLESISGALCELLVPGSMDNVVCAAIVTGVRLIEP